MHGLIFAANRSLLEDDYDVVVVSVYEGSTPKANAQVQALVRRRLRRTFVRRGLLLGEAADAKHDPATSVRSRPLPPKIDV